MKSNHPAPLSPKVVQVLRAARNIEPAAEDVRRRAMGRALSALEAKRVAANTVGSLRWRWRVIAPLALGLAGLAAAAWMRWHGPLPHGPQFTNGNRITSELSPDQSPSAASTAERPSAPVASAAASDSDLVTAASAAVQRVDRGALELTLLDAARKATRSGDFATALSVLREHEQRFPRGHLVEEREALKVKALFGLGRDDEAKQAAEGFRRRFPQSVFLPSVNRMMGAAR
jgi:hypothetical protein